MNKEFIPYEQALALKELGFDEPCFGFYNNAEAIPYIKQDLTDELKLIYTGDFEAPLFQQAFRWFREKYGLQHEITRQGTNYWLLTILEIDKVTINGIFNGKKYDIDDYIKNEPKSYEEAELECLKKLIEIVKNDVELQTKNN